MACWLQRGGHGGFKVFRIGKDGSGLVDLTAGAAGIHEHPSN